MANKSKRILVIPAGAGNSVTLIKHLKGKKNTKVFTCDIDPLAIGLFLADGGFTVPRFESRDFFDHLFKLVARKN